MRNILVTAGFINPEPLKRLCKVTAGVNLDIKGFTERFYREVCGGSLAPVLEAANRCQNARASSGLYPARAM